MPTGLIIDIRIREFCRVEIMIVLILMLIDITAGQRLELQEQPVGLILILGRDEVTGARGQTVIVHAIGEVNRVKRFIGIFLEALVVSPNEGTTVCALQRHCGFEDGLDLCFEGGDVERFHILGCDIIMRYVHMIVVTGIPAFYVLPIVKTGILMSMENEVHPKVIDR